MASEDHCFCAAPACAAEIFEHDDYVHFAGEFWHVNCWWQALSLPPTYLSDFMIAARHGPLAVHEESASDAKWKDGRYPGQYKE